MTVDALTLALDVGTNIYIVGLVVGLTFTIIYGVSAPWWRTAIGRMFMAVSSGIVVAGVVVLLSIFLGVDYPGRPVVRIVGYAVFAVSMLTLLFTYLHERNLSTSHLPLRKPKEKG